MRYSDMVYRVVIFFVSVFLLLGCSGGRHDARLAHVAGIVSDSPREALSCLDSIDYRSLSTRDRHYHDFLSLKARDKAYVVHESDSLILDLLDYYSSDKGMYPEVLYYGGRVYSDLGDYPTALQYFYTALDNLPQEDRNLSLKRNILSQTGRLLNSLRLYNDAIPYIKGAIEIDRQLNDSINEVYNIQLLGAIHLRDHDYPNAERYFRLALAKSDYLPVSHKAKSLMYIAGIKYKTGQIDSALMYIRNTPDLVKPIARNSALACAADIYYTAGKKDSAYLYAYELVKSLDNTNKQTGYEIILSPDLRHLSSPDSINGYITDYVSLLESSFNENENQLALNRQSFHNYQIHERERQKAEKSNVALRQWLLGSSILVLLLGIVILFLKNRDANNRLKLHAALENVERLRQSLKIEKENAEKDKSPVDVVPVEKKLTTSELRDKLKKELFDLYNSNTDRAVIEPEILKSDTYRELQELISKGKELQPDSDLWSELESLVLKCSPNFITSLQLLAGGRLNSNDLHTVLLIKCGIQPTQMSILLNRSKGTIVSRRESLCLRIYGEKLGTKVIDGIIHLL